MSSRINVLDHDMVPNHQVMSEDEVKALLRELARSTPGNQKGAETT